MMSNKTTKTALIVLGSVGGAAALGAIAVSVWNSKKMRAMRAVKRTNMVLGRVGNVLCKISEMGCECM